MCESLAAAVSTYDGAHGPASTVAGDLLIDGGRAAEDHHLIKTELGRDLHASLSLVCWKAGRSDPSRRW